MKRNEISITLSEIDNGYMVEAKSASDFTSSFETHRAIIGFKEDSETAEDLLQVVCEEILSKLLGRSKTFGGKLHAHVRLSVSFVEDPANPIEMH